MGHCWDGILYLNGYSTTISVISVVFLRKSVTDDHKLCIPLFLVCPHGYGNAGTFGDKPAARARSSCRLFCKESAFSWKTLRSAASWKYLVVFLIQVATAYFWLCGDIWAYNCELFWLETCKVSREGIQYPRWQEIRLNYPNLLRGFGLQSVMGRGQGRVVAPGVT